MSNILVNLTLVTLYTIDSVNLKLDSKTPRQSVLFIFPQYTSSNLYIASTSDPWVGFNELDGPIMMLIWLYFEFLPLILFNHMLEPIFFLIQKLFGQKKVFANKTIDPKNYGQFFCNLRNCLAKKK